MNTRLILRLLAVVSLLVPAIRARADLGTEADSLSARSFSLNLFEKNVRDASDREELRANRQATAQPSPLSAANFDKNKDGKLDDAEFATWTAELRKVAVKTPDAMKRFDKNHDGQLSDPEWNAALDELFGSR